MNGLSTEVMVALAKIVFQKAQTMSLLFVTSQGAAV